MDESEKISIILTWEDKIWRETDFLLELDNEVKVSIPKWVEMIKKEIDLLETGVRIDNSGGCIARKHAIIQNGYENNP